jgi:acyl carrier protein
MSNATEAALETIILRSFREVCGFETVDRDEDFFEVGGTSLQAVEIVTQLQARLGDDLPLLAIFFENPNVAAIAAAIVEALTPEERETIDRLLAAAG